MSIHVALQHTTLYTYDRLVALSPQVVRLRPAPHTRTRILSYSLRVEPGEHFINWQQDPFANHLARLVFPERTRQLRVTVDLVAEMAVHNPFDFFLEPGAEDFPLAYAAELQAELAPYLVTEPLTPRLRAYLDKVKPAGPARTIDYLVALNQRLQGDIAYLIRLEPGVQTPEQTLSLGSGSCRDSGWLLVTLLRHLGLAARFVSGYLIQLVADEKPLDGPAGTDRDFTDLHAWCEVYLPGAGWIGFDPTSGLLAGEGHIPLACSPQPGSAAPISGAVDECEVAFEHHMQVTRVHESPRVTLPYSEPQWQRVLHLGEQVEARLQAQDVRLTMGGEPTFVAVDDRDAPEWNTEALGPTKRLYGLALMAHLQQAYGQGGFLHLGQGKWYPGEQLPRWALSCYWRRDGEPCWHEPRWLADERQPRQASAEDAQRFMASLCRQLGLSGETVLPGFEDSWYYLWRERRLPTNVDPFDSRLDDELERARLRRVFGQGLASVVGYALPLAAREDGGGWQTGAWFLRDERLYLMPGDSPMGYRLPLDSLPWAQAGDLPWTAPLDPYAERAALPSAARLRQQARPLSTAPAATHAATQAAAAPARFASAAGQLRTALCVEARDTRRANGAQAEQQGQANRQLYVFLPPVQRLEDFLALLAALEAACAETGLPVVLEGYPPPRDPRLAMLQITPDPGVLEVNIHPSPDWATLVQRTEHLYEAARQCRLAPEKFMLDGRHTGTGGGNHVVLGGATPADSPFLRRPSLLASLLRYWLNHPALSYLFSGLFIGPTSQAPRVDEARQDQVRELEIALAEIERLGDNVPPWVIDRALRNLLVDVSGNTHRAEFCIDKLYDPLSSTGRLGLLELRGFEMPPHARMSLVQQLLIRALVARCWARPYRQPLARWGTALHDRFMLPSFIELDLQDVLFDLAQAGFAFERAWFDPQLAFRFPRIGELAMRGVQLQLRHALEPWHVMGEEGMAGGTVRFVDASLERLELKVSGWFEPRFRLTVNGHAVPLQPTGRAGEFVAGLRYRAWQPVSALHPTIAAHAPLTFDLVDTELGRSLGGGQYHVAHPGGRNYQTFPVNAFEAESRRLARFFTHGHSPQALAPGPAQPSLEFPFTLDLRRV